MSDEALKVLAAHPTDGNHNPINRGARITFGALVATALFSPYLAGGVRLFQPMLYLAAIFALFGLLRHWFTPVKLAAFLAPWMLILLVAIGGYLWGYRMVDPEWRSPIGALDSLVVIICSALVTAWILSIGVKWRSILSIIAWTLVVFALTNVVIQLLQIVSSDSSWLLSWWTGSEQGRIGGLEASYNRRYVGLISQPAELGVITSLALGAAVMLLRKRIFFLVSAVTLIILSGILSQSKAFLFIGVPLVLLTGVRRKGAIYVPLVLALIWVALARALPTLGWEGSTRLAALFDFSAAPSLLALVTGNRFGETSAIVESLNFYYGVPSSLYGFGLETPPVPTDSQYLQVFFWAGAIGLVAFIFFQIFFIRSYLLFRRSSSVLPEERAFLGFFVVFISVSAVGFPVWTANHVSFLLVAIGLVLTLQLRSRFSQAHRGTKTAIIKR